MPSELDATLGGQSGIALDHRRLHLDGAAHGIHNAPELGERAVSRPLDDASAVHGDGRIDEIAAERSEPGQGAVFIGPGKPAVPDHIRGQDCSEFPLLGHLPLSPTETLPRRRAERGTLPAWLARGDALKPRYATHEFPAPTGVDWDYYSSHRDVPGADINGTVPRRRSANKRARVPVRYQASRYAPVCNHSSAFALSPLANTLMSGWAKCWAIVGAIFKKALSVTAATRSMLRW